jgi:excisionase family DNA binding protein
MLHEWMTIEEAASYLGLSESYIRSHITKGWLDSYQHGYPIRLKDSEVDVFLLPFERY